MAATNYSSSPKLISNLPNQQDTDLSKCQLFVNTLIDQKASKKKKRQARSLNSRNRASSSQENANLSQEDEFCDDGKNKNMKPTKISKKEIEHEGGGDRNSKSSQQSFESGQHPN